MGMILETTPDMGEYSVEVRKESFYLSGENNAEIANDELRYVPRRHSVTVYPADETVNQGTIELLIEDIPKIRACLDNVERYLIDTRGAVKAR